MCLIFCPQGDKTKGKIIIELNRCLYEKISTTLEKSGIRKGGILCRALALDCVTLYRCFFHRVHPCKIQSYHLMLHPHLKVDCSELCHMMMDWVPPGGLLNTPLSTSWICFFWNGPNPAEICNTAQ